MKSPHGGNQYAAFGDIDIVGRRVQHVGQFAQRRARCPSRPPAQQLVHIILAVGQRRRAPTSGIYRRSRSAPRPPFRSLTSLKCAIQAPLAAAAGAATPASGRAAASVSPAADRLAARSDRAATSALAPISRSRTLPVTPCAPVTWRSQHGVLFSTPSSALGQGKLRSRRSRSRAPCFARVWP